MLEVLESAVPFSGGFKLPGHAITTRHSASAYPWQCGAGLPAVGPIIGWDLLTAGGQFCYDPWELYDRGIITCPNMIVVGRMGKGKSAFVKAYLHRQFLFGRTVCILDPKGEYGPFARAHGLTHLKLRPGGDCRVDALAAEGLGPRDAFRRRVDTLAALAATGLDRPLVSIERSAIELALKEIAMGGKEPTMQRVVELLLRPTEGMAVANADHVDHFADQARDVAVQLRRLLDGDLAGMFDGTPNTVLDHDTRGIVVDLSAVYNTPAMAPVMVCAGSWLSGIITSQRGLGNIILVIDEGWGVLGLTETTRWLQQTWKLARTYRVQGVLVIHKVADLVAQGDEGAERTKQALGLLATTETRVIFNQAPDQLAGAATAFGLTDTETEVIGKLPRWRSLWLVGEHGAVVQHHLQPLELEFSKTDTGVLT